MTLPDGHLASRVPPGLAWALTAGVAAWLTSTTLSRPGLYLGDLDIYRGAVLSAARGGSLYDYVLYRPGLRPEGFGFTYPPFAGLLMWPLGAVPPATAGALWTLGGIAAAALIGAVVGAERPGPPSPALGAALATLALLISYPTVSTLVLGQVTLFVTAATILDALVVPRRFRGWLTGLAGAVKLVPLAFLGYYLLTRQWGAALKAGAGFLLAGFVAAIVLPDDSRVYWGFRMWTTGFVGDPAEPRNRSLLGFLLRIADDGPALRAGWLLLVLLLAAGAALAIRRHAAAGERVRAVVVSGCLIVAAAPISWTHYLVWVPLAGLLLANAGGAESHFQRLAWRTAGVLVILGSTLASPTMQESLPTSALAAALQEMPGLFVVGVAALGLPSSRPGPVSP